MGSCEIRFGQKQDYHVLNPLPSLFVIQLAETKVKALFQDVNLTLSSAQCTMKNPGSNGICGLGKNEA